jgi:ABC-type phosphate transport system permease subunit
MGLKIFSLVWIGTPSEKIFGILPMIVGSITRLPWEPYNRIPLGLACAVCLTEFSSSVFAKY